jgi:hypothetical protein
VLGYFLAEQGFNTETVKKIIGEVFPHIISSLIQSAKEENKSISEIARRRAEYNLGKMLSDNKAFFIKKMALGRMTWLLYKLLLKIRMNFLLFSYAKKYIKSQLMGNYKCIF